MTTADVVREQALQLARTEPDREEAIRVLETVSEGRRVAAVLARRRVSAWLDSEPDQADAIRAIELLDLLLDRLPA